MKKIRTAIVILLLTAVPVTRYFLEFQRGQRCEPYGMLDGVMLLLAAPPLIAIATGFLVPFKRTVHRLAAAVGAFLLVPFLAIFAVPAGAIIYSRGFEHAVRAQPGIPELQRWAEKTLRDYQSGAFSATNEPSFWSPGDVRIAPEDLPPFLKTGIFVSTGTLNFGPEVSVCVRGGKAGLQADCVAVSWYLHGLLIGAPDFRTVWNPWYCEEMAPGVYSYHGMK
jgi:hypothetical protein